MQVFYESYNSFDGIEHIYDYCLVWASQIQKQPALGRYRGKLAYCFCRVLFSGSRKQNWLLPVLYRTAQNHSGGYHACCVFRFFRTLSEGRFQMELSGRFSADYRRRLYYFQEVVSLPYVWRIEPVESKEVKDYSKSALFLSLFLCASAPLFLSLFIAAIRSARFSVCRKSVTVFLFLPSQNCIKAA
jgi:hypothetical protein